MNNLQEYYDALQRLKDNRPKVVPKGSKINNDTVALEAGKKRGSIKRSREVFIPLIEEIKSIQANEQAPKIKYEERIEKYKNKCKEYKSLYEGALNRELMLIERINELEKTIQSRRPEMVEVPKIVCELPTQK